MGAIHCSIPTELASKLQREFSLSTFVETGLGQGTSILWAEKHFETCISIENDFNSIVKFKNEHSQSKSVIFYGDSGKMLCFGIVHSIIEDALFWLDAHTDDYTPVLVEVAAINASRLNHIIMVDDLRLFGQLPAWPTLMQLTDMLHGQGRMTFEVDDVLIAAPLSFTNRMNRLLSREK